MYEAVDLGVEMQFRTEEIDGLRQAHPVVVPLTIRQCPTNTSWASSQLGFRHSQQSSLNMDGSVLEEEANAVPSTSGLLTR